MTSDTIELKDKWERVAKLIAADLSKDEHVTKKPAEPQALRYLRNGFIGATAAFGGVGLGLSILRWNDVLIPATGVIAWLAAGMGLSIASAVMMQLAINRRANFAGHDRVIAALDVGVKTVCHEIRASRPAEQADLSQVAALLDAFAAQMQQLTSVVAMSGIQVSGKLAEMAEEIKQLRQRLAEIEQSAARDDAFVDLLSAQDAPKGNGKVTRMIRPARPDDRPWR